MKQGFKRAVFWNENRSKITTQSKNINLDNTINPTFSNINRLFVISFKNGQIDAVRDSLDKFYMALAGIKDFNALIDNSPLFDKNMKNKKEAHEKLVEMLENDDYATWKLLSYSYHQNYYNTLLK